MGCGGSKVDDLPLVIRCKARKELIKSAMNYRYVLSSSHVAYFHSLKDIGYALSRFVDEEVVIPSSNASSPVLALPSDEGKTNSSISHIHSIDGNEGSHLHISTDSEPDLHSSSSGHIHIYDDKDDNDNIDDIDRVPGNRSIPPLSSIYPPYSYNQTNWNGPFVMNGYGENSYQPPEDPAFESAWGPYGGIFYSYGGYRGNPNVYYMKKPAPVSRTVVIEEARGFQESGRWPDPSDYNVDDSGGFFGLSMNGSSRQDERKQHNRPKAPSPPPPPNVSGWDFLNFFDGYESYGYGYGSVVSSPDTSELREREGIPDLEEETENESHSEEVNMGRKLDTKRNSGERFIPKENFEASSTRGPSRSSGASSKQVSPGKSDGSSKAGHNGGASSSVPSQNDEGTTVTPEAVSRSAEEKNEGKKGVSFDVDEGSIHEVESSRLSSLTTLSAQGSRDLQEVFNEIKDEFDVAFGYGKEVATMLEAGKVPHRRKFPVLKVALTRILYLVAPSSSQSERLQSQIKKLATSYNLDAVADVKSFSLSSTLDKLYAWEKKLYKEVKDEERLRLVYDNMCKRLKDLDARGAESRKVDAVQASVRGLLTKLDVCIQAIDSISINIQKVRDEELQPQVNELIYGFIRMWKLMVKCHRKQFQAIMASKTLRLKANTASKLSATAELKTGLLTWSKHFDDWINAQKSYVNSLNGWLQQCIDHEPEVTIDGNVPFSPGRIGAPPIFIICDDWHNGIKHVSEKHVSEAIHVLALRLRQMLERQDEEQHQRLKSEQLAKDFSEKRQNLRGSIVSLETDDLKAEVRLLRKKTDEARARHKEALKLAHDAASSSLQGGMVPLFKALENFTGDVLKAHEQVRFVNTKT